ncbi:phthiocerol/phthiodiolone dimycocerosyl transferase family protein [Streptomyces sp. NBC_01237]|uniref:phthiocerol/phthiodiolone dimycocerosyl transferase family protein n=1 Tax=Streptomyces sp. NBC_01237 TaxID=2903790 RepID=UPI002DD87CD1|nr:condensation protein [Streptomyces sp. NBC_01237]WRZ77568.1 condensation protein [Streptomyces sp. NBC_01237]
MVERLLAPHEAAIAEGGVRLVLHSDVEGDLDEEILTEALARLRSSYPLLAGSIVRGADGEQVVRIDETAPGPLLNNGVDLDQEISAPLAWDKGPLLRLTLLHEPHRTRVVMTLPRAFSDGMSYLAVHQRLWDLYTALSTRRPVATEPVRPVLGPALDDMLASRFTPQQLREFVAERARLDAGAPPSLLPALASRNGAPGPDTSFGIIGVEADADRCGRLVQCAHDASLTLNALVSGILLTSLRSLFPAAVDPVRMLCTTAVDMRRRLDPPLPDQVLQSAATTTSIRLRVTDRSHPVEVGHDLAARLRADLDTGAAAMELAAFAYMLDQHPPSLVITNVGIITEPRLPGGLRIRDVRLAPLGHVPMIFAVVSRYKGRLAVDLTYSRAWYTDAQIQELARHVSVALDDLVA